MRESFQIKVDKEQQQYAIKLVDYSIKHHPVTDIFSNTQKGRDNQRLYRFIGCLGEVVFADLYNVERPKKAFGAIDGQDNGKDFVLEDKIIDVKSMHRKSDVFYENYVLNIPSHQLSERYNEDAYYCCISFNRNEEKELLANVIGFVSKKKLKNGEIGTLFKKGTKRTRKNGTAFNFETEDTYEIEFKDIKKPKILPHFLEKNGFKIIKLKLFQN